jgi:hypothetical protein
MQLADTKAVIMKIIHDALQTNEKIGDLVKQS